MPDQLYFFHSCSYVNNNVHLLLRTVRKFRSTGIKSDASLWTCSSPTIVNSVLDFILAIIYFIHPLEPSKLVKKKKKERKIDPTPL